MTTTETASATDAELDDALLAALRAAPGGVMAWAELRELLPPAPYWATVAALVRLQAEGTVSVEKDDKGRNVVTLAPVLPTLRRRS